MSYYLKKKKKHLSRENKANSLAKGMTQLLRMEVSERGKPRSITWAGSVCPPSRQGTSRGAVHSQS